MLKPNLAIIAIAAALLCPACSGPQPKDSLERYRAVKTDTAGLRTIAMLPMERGPASEESVEIIKQSIAAGLARHYNVVLLRRVPAGIVAPEEELLVDTLLAAREETGADAVLEAKIIDYRRHEPPAITMSLRLHSTTTGEVLASVCGTLDSANPDTEKLVKQYFEKTQEGDRSLLGWRTMLLAERRYAQFAADRFLLSMNPETRPRRQ
ncbi:MAG TPA: hypothetical protein VM141_01635 [Planctomycetota bacterium]|nr:hypothetical protein [Planctomycetota bacterium]